MKVREEFPIETVMYKGVEHVKFDVEVFVLFFNSVMAYHPELRDITRMVNGHYNQATSTKNNRLKKKREKQALTEMLKVMKYANSQNK